MTIPSLKCHSDDFIVELEEEAFYGCHQTSAFVPGVFVSEHNNTMPTDRIRTETINENRWVLLMKLTIHLSLPLCYSAPSKNENIHRDHEAMKPTR